MPPGETAGPRWTVVVPFYDEADNVVPVLEELHEVMQGLGDDYEVVVIDDGSTDGTRERAAEATAGWPQWRLVGLERNHGQAAALYLGMHLARAPVIVTMDGDGQNVPADIPALLELLPAADLVTGVRAERSDSGARRWVSRLANVVRARVLADGVTDAGCGLRVMRREVVEAFIPIRTLYSFIPALAVAAGFRVLQHPVRHRPRLRGEAKYGLRVFLWRPVLDMLGVWWFRHRRFPRLRALSQAKRFE
jgi:glycosyltransferase involved in cell wall biosynthesis